MGVGVGVGVGVFWYLKNRCFSCNPNFNYHYFKPWMEGQEAQIETMPND
jgi:hypothetical protein